MSRASKVSGEEEEEEKEEGWRGRQGGPCSGGGEREKGGMAMMWRR